MPISFASILPYPWLIICLSAILAFIITWLAIPRIVFTARINNLFVQTNARTSHKNIVPNLGGIAVFSGFVVSTIILGGSYFSFDLIYIVCALIIILFIGIKDDLTFSNPWKKLFGQILAIAITSMLADIRINNIYGMFGIFELSYIASILFTIFVFLVIINGFNLIDGIDGLASGIGITTATVFGIWFWVTGDFSYAVLSLSLSAALAAFFYFNVFSKTFKLFLGDTGSLVIGFVLGILTCRFLQVDFGTTGIAHINSAPAVAVGILIIPLFDTLRVFTLRIWQGKSPFIADRQHIHHRLIDLGMSHLQATLVLIFSNLIFILLSFLLQELGVINLGLIILVSASLLSLVLRTAARKNIHIAEQTDLTFEGTWNRQIITKNLNKRSLKEKDQPIESQFPIKGPEESQEPERKSEPQPLTEKKLLPTNKEIHADLD